MLKLQKKYTTLIKKIKQNRKTKLYQSSSHNNNPSPIQLFVTSFSSVDMERILSYDVPFSPQFCNFLKANALKDKKLYFELACLFSLKFVS